MRPRNIVIGCLLLIGCLVLAPASMAHDLFLKLQTFFVAPNSAITVSLINGSFDNSENAIARDRMLDVRVTGPEDEVSNPPESRWRDEDNAALLGLDTGGEGTYTIAVSTAPRIIELSAEDFNEYLQHDGVVDTLAARRDSRELELDARERYSKHVKAIMQVGEQRSGGFAANLGYPVEFVPLENPYTLGVGDALGVRFLKDGKPVANQMIYASHDSFHGHDEDGNHIEAFHGRTNADGVVTVPLTEPGLWYLRTIFMEKVDEQDADYESNWATLTFEVEARRP